jgi:hypothetical protein
MLHPIIETIRFFNSTDPLTAVQNTPGAPTHSGIFPKQRPMHRRVAYARVRGNL